MTQKPQSNIAKPLKSYLERIEKLQEEKAGIGSDITDIFREAKGNGFDPKTMRAMLALRKLNSDDRAEREFLRDSYLKALGLIDDDLT